MYIHTSKNKRVCESPRDLAAWFGTLGSIVPSSTKESLRDRIVAEGFDGWNFANVLEKDGLVDLNVQGMTRGIAQKIRRCWYQDFPGMGADHCSTNVFGHGRSPLTPRSVSSPGHRTLHQSGLEADHFEVSSVGHSPCQRGRGPPNSTPRCAEARSGGEGLATTSRNPAHMDIRPGKFACTSDSKGMWLQGSTCKSDTTLEHLSVESLLYAALECVCLRLGLDCREVCSWWREVLPEIVWQKLWQRLRNSQSCAMDRGDMSSYPQEAQHVVQDPAWCLPSDDGCASAFQGASDNDDSNSSVPSPVEVKHGSRARGWALYDPTLRSMPLAAIGVSRSPLASPSSEVSSRPCPPVPPMTPIELANWLRHLPSSRLSDEVKRTAARQILDRGVDGQQFQAVVDGQVPWAQVGVEDEKHSAAIARLYQEKQRERTLAAVARTNAQLNASWHSRPVNQSLHKLICVQTRQTCGWGS